MAIDNEMSDLSCLPLLDRVYMCVSTYNFWLVLDEADNSDLISFFDYTVIYAIEIDKELNKAVVLVSLEDKGPYTKIKEKFPDIKKIGVYYYNTTYPFVPHRNIKGHYDTIKDKDKDECTFARCPRKSITSPETLRLFSYGEYSHYGQEFYHIEVPDFSVYNKLVLIVGGSESLSVYHASRKHR